VNFALREVVAVLKELVEEMVKAIVDHPEEVTVNVMAGQQTTVIELHVSPEDMGKVIGRQGRTAKAMRTLLSAAGMKIGKRASLEILE